jgi:hypothetical protein
VSISIETTGISFWQQEPLLCTAYAVIPLAFTLEVTKPEQGEHQHSCASSNKIAKAYLNQQ